MTKKFIEVKQETIAIHKAFEKGNDGKRKLTVYMSDGSKTTALKSEEEMLKVLHGMPPETIIRSTWVNATDATLLALHESGHKIMYAYWHDTGIASQLPAAEIVAQYALLPENIFREFRPRKDYAQLRRKLDLRAVVVTATGDAVRRTKQIIRNGAHADSEEIKSTLRSIAKMARVLVEDDGTIDGCPYDTAVRKYAATMPDCQLAAKVMGVDFEGDEIGIIPAMFVGYSGGFDRFPTIASLWHYCGLHVVDGRSPKRKKGQNIDWNPKMRQALYQFGLNLVIKRAGGEVKKGNRKGQALPLSPWRAMFDAERAKELATHDAKCPNCKTKEGHSTNRAIRKVVKEFVKRFFIAYNGERYIKNHNPLAVEKGKAAAA